MFIRAAYLLSQSKNAIAALELRRYLGLRYRSAWPIKHKLMSDGLGAFRAVADLNHAHTVIQVPPGKAGTEGALTAASTSRPWCRAYWLRPLPAHPGPSQRCAMCRFTGRAEDWR